MEQLFQKSLNPNTPKILCVGKNYIKHVKEMGGKENPTELVFFIKPMTSIYQGMLISLISKETVFHLPKHGREVHHEIELGYMISK
jgi:acylpyruvate hydrolase